MFGEVDCYFDGVFYVEKILYLFVVFVFRFMVFEELNVVGGEDLLISFVYEVMYVGFVVFVWVEDIEVFYVNDVV